MAIVSVDSELMTNYISALPVPAGSHHVTVLDEKRMPVVFCLSNDRPSPRLQILRRDNKGHSQLFDLHKLVNLPDDAIVQNFHVQQSWSLNLYLAIAYQDSDSTSVLHLMKPFRPEQLQDNGQVIGQITGGQRFGSIQRIYMCPISGVNSDIEYPDIFLAHQQLDQTVSWGSDLKHIHVRGDFEGWFATQQLSTPENVSQILDIATASSHYGQGLYVLYVTQGRTKLFARFLRPDPNATDGAMYSFVTTVKCPDGARCIASVLNDDGNTCLLISAPDGIRYLTAGESIVKDRNGTLILKADMFKNIRQLSVAQDKNDMTIWFRNAKDELGYVRTKADNIARAAVSSLLLPAGMSSAFAPVVSAPSTFTGDTVRQMVISNDRKGNIMLIEQSSDIGLWRKTPFYKPSKSTPSELKSYTVTVKAKDHQGNPLSYGSLRISASSSVSIILQGQNTLLKSIPTWFDCDQSGSLDFIIPSDSLGAQEIKIEKVRSLEGAILNFAKVKYDPSFKPMNILSEKLKAVSDDKFDSLQTQSGEDLFDEDVKKDEDLMKNAKNCLQIITQAYADISPAPVSSMALSSTVTTASLTTKMITTVRSISNSFGDALMDGWFWITENIHKATDWGIKVAGSAWKFFCTIAGDIKEFVLDCVEKICEAATWIWEKLKVGWQKLINFIGFIFRWDDILATKNTISSTITAGFGYAALKMDDISTKVDGFFANMEKTVDQFGTSIKLDKQIGNAESNKDDKVQDAQTSTSSNWASERLKNGGAGSDTTVDFKGEKPSKKATDFWNDAVVPEVKKLDAALGKVGTDITDLFKKEGSIDGNDIINVSKSLLKAGIAAVRGIVKGLLQLVKIFIGKLSELGNAEIDIPIFSWLYQKITNGHTLTLFDAISLIVAIPTTIFSKLITGKAPPTFQNMDATLIKGLVEGGDIESHVKTEWAIFKAEITVGITLTSGAIGIMKLLYKMATQGLDEVLDKLNTGPSSLFDIFGIVVDMIGCLMAIPEHEDMPGAEYRHCISSISCIRGVYHTIAFFTKGGPVFEKVVLSLDLLTVFANLGLSVAVGIAEHEAGDKWKDYDEAATNNGFITSGLNALAGIAYFTAFFFKTNPDISAVGAAVMVGTMGGAAVLEGIVFKLQYDAQKKPILTSPPAF